MRINIKIGGDNLALLGEWKNEMVLVAWWERVKRGQRICKINLKEKEKRGNYCRKIEEYPCKKIGKIKFIGERGKRKMDRIVL